MNPSPFVARRFGFRFLCVCLPLLLTFNESPGQDTAEVAVEVAEEATEVESAQEEATESRITLFQTKRPVREHLQLLETAFGGQDVKMVPDDARNALLVRGPQEQLERIARLLQMIDQPDRQLIVDVTAEVLNTGSEQKLTDRFSLPVRQNHIALLNSAMESTATTGRMVVNGRQITQQSKTSPIGTTLEVTPKLTGETVELDLLFEKSWSEASIVENGERNAASTNNYVAKLDTSLRLKLSQSAEASVTAQALNGKQRQLKITITVRDASASTADAADQSATNDRQASKKKTLEDEPAKNEE
ncbi:MAG: hypothetical protein Fues2KO_32610 [Fuerstiella sp.]